MTEKEIIDQYLIEHSIPYLLTETETRIFNELAINDSDSPYTPFIVVLLKETNYNMAKFLRIISSATKTPGFTPRGLVRKVLMLIRESLIVNEIRTNKYVSVTELTKVPRYHRLGINRNNIYQTINKYNLR